MSDVAAPAERPVRWWRWGRIAAAALLVLLVTVALLWTQREPIARDVVARTLRAKGVQASYRISRFGVTGQTLEHVVIGDPAAPDLVAARAELGIAYRFGLPRLRSIRAEGVRLRGRIVDSRLSLGSIDRLMPAPSGAPFTLPDLAVDLRDARMRLETPQGPVGLALEGHGNLADGFAGQLAAVTRDLDLGGCRATGATAYLRVEVKARRPSLRGPVRTRAIACPGSGLEAAAGAADLRVAFGEALDHWQGEARAEFASLRHGADRLDRLTGTIGFSGDGRATSGSAGLAAAAVRFGPVARGRLGLDAGWRVAGAATRVDGTLRLADAVLDPTLARSLAASRDAAAGTPVAPVWRQLAAALAAAAKGGSGEAEIRLERGRDGGTVRITRAEARSASGARLRFAGAGIGYDWPTGGLTVDGTLVVAGGGLPVGELRLASRPGGGLAGEARAAPLAADGARLALAPVRWSSAGGTTRFATVATLDGPVADGRIEGLRLPVAGRFGRDGLIVGEACAPIAFARLAVAGMVLGPGRLPLCPAGGALLRRSRTGAIDGGASIVGPRLAGSIGSAPATIAAARIGVTLGRPGFTADGVEVRIGAGDTLTRFDAASLAGQSEGGGIGGRFTGLGGNIGAVPFTLAEGAGDWRLHGGVVMLAGALRVADRAANARFLPLAGRDVRLRLAGGRIDATGRLVEPKSGTLVSNVALAHDLASGTGHATLDVPGIAFTEALQPEALTPLTLGVVAQVRGTVTGTGRIDWTAQGVTSSGRFRSDGLDLAAAFGPVKGLKGEIQFSDLLALATPPGQTATVAEVNPGVAVTGGTIRYQLLPEQRMRVEGGRWPFSGGELVLEPTELDFGRPSDRRLTFRIAGLDAAEFVQQFQFKDIAITGTFDGVLPMIFDERGGRIVGGRLAVRRGGGTLAYVGQLSQEKLGTFARLAFDALKAMRYDALEIDLDGALDGELVSRVLFNGTNQTPKDARGGFLSQLSGLPFRFNITVRAPFRGLLNSAQAFSDPRGLIGQALPQRSQPSVQPKESEVVP